MLRLQYATRAAIIGALLISPACGSSDNGSPTAPANSEDGQSGASTSGLGTAGKASEAASDAGAGGETGHASQCSGCASGFCLDDGTCVDCLPSNDQCPSGEYCSDENRCEPGCKDDTRSCASGVCGKDHNCKRCIDDSECFGGRICSGGECTEACGAAQEGTSSGCRSDMVCCSERCSDLTVDSRNCGACGKACASGQFCGRTACDSNGEGGAGGAESETCVECHDTTLAGVCSVAKVTVILDTNKNSSDGNRVPGRAIGAALRDACPTKPALAEAEQDSVEALNITTGRPVSDSSELLVVAGGPFYQNLEGYLEEQKITPLYWTYDNETSAYRRAGTKEAIVSLPISGDHDSHDFFIVQFTRDPASGSLILNVQGFWLSGTVAGAYQVIHGLLPELSKQDKAWYAYEWTDQDGDKAPDLNEIRLVDSGS